MHFNGELAEGEAKTGPPSMTLWRLPEKLEDYLVVFFSNPDSVVLDLDDNPFARRMVTSKLLCVPGVAVN